MSVVKKNIRKSKTIPSQFYYCNTKFEQIKKKIFAKSWQFICDKTEVNNNGDVFPYDFIEHYIQDPLLLINNNNTIKSISNVCTHRGNILIKNPCNLKDGIMIPVYTGTAPVSERMVGVVFVGEKYP